MVRDPSSIINLCADCLVRHHVTNARFGPVPGALSYMFLNRVLFKHHHGKHPTIHRP